MRVRQGIFRRRYSAGLVLLASLAGHGPTLVAQDSNQAIGQQLDQALESLGKLDGLAAGCLSMASPEAGTSPGQTAPCLEFSRAIDGEPLASYATACRLARQWRDAFVERYNVDPAVATDTEQSLAMLVRTEYVCGDDALARRSPSVLRAYELVGRGSVTDAAAGPSLQLQLDTYRQETLMRQERERFTGTLQRQRQTGDDQTRRQLDQLELELMRQQATDPALRR